MLLRSCTLLRTSARRWHARSCFQAHAICQRSFCKSSLAAEERAVAPATDKSQGSVAPVASPPLMLDPAQTMDKLVSIASVRADRPLGEMFASAFLGGTYLAWGGSMFVLVAGGCSGALAASVPGLHSLIAALVFPSGLSMILLTGTDLLTSNMMYGVLPFLTHPGRTLQKKIVDLSKLWSVSFAGNALGSMLIAACASAWIFLPGSPGASFIAAATVKKCALPLTTMVGKAMCANWLVNLAVFQATTATTTAGKMAGVWMPVTAFVALGLEHSVANMFLLPLGKLCGADVTWIGDILVGNILPVCVGNALGAGIFVAGMQWYATGGARRIVRSAR